MGEEEAATTTEVSPIADGDEFFVKAVEELTSTTTAVPVQKGQWSCVLVVGLMAIGLLQH